jgi:hypothetical protein
MATGTDSASRGERILSTLHGFIGARTVVMLFLGVLAGFSIGAIGKDVVVVPVVGSVSGLLVGSVGLVVSLAAYSRTGCCENCDRKLCGCTGDCGDSCSVDS